MQPPPDPRLDLFQREFDPLLALSVEPTNVGSLDHNLLPLDNLQQARRLLPDDDVDYLPPPPPSHRNTEHGEEEITRTRKQPAKFVSPLFDLAQSFERRGGPLDLLRTALGKRVRVMVNRDRGQFSTCDGILSGFDRHVNIVLDDGMETYMTHEFATVSKRSRNSPQLVANFIKEFGLNLSPHEIEELLSRYAGKPTADLWADLHGRCPRLRDTILDLMRQHHPASTAGDADKLLARRAGHERALILQLRARNEGGDGRTVSPAITAEWVKLPSERHPGHYYFLNNQTNASVWETPPGVDFVTVKVAGQVQRTRPFRKMMVRGSVIVMVTVLTLKEGESS